MKGLFEIDARTWETPLTGTESRTVGRARLKHETYGRGYYRFEGTMGFEFYKVTRGRLPVTVLQRREGRRWKIWMVDDPLHWFGMESAVMDLPSGSVLCAGLGLGLMAHHLAERDDIDAITIVEWDQDVIDLISPTLPPDSRVTIVRDDFYEYIKRPDVAPQGILWDLAVGNPAETLGDFIRVEAMAAVYQPDAHLVRFGERRQPAFA